MILSNASLWVDEGKDWTMDPFGWMWIEKCEKNLIVSRFILDATRPLKTETTLESDAVSADGVL